MMKTFNHVGNDLKDLKTEMETLSKSPLQGPGR